MIDIRSLYVRAGDLVIPAWRKLVSALQTLPVLPGVGVLITRTPRGSVVNARAFLKGFIGAWAMGTPTAAEIRVGEGYLNAEMPADAGPKAKAVPLSEKTFDKTGRSWIVLEVTVGDDGATDPKKTRIVQADHPYRAERKQIGRTPLAVLYRGEAKKGFGVLHRIAYFDLQHRYNAATGRHFFFI